MKHSPKPPVSEKRLAANRANAARSTGPKSDEGKSVAAQNSRKHGFTASKFAVVRLEELDALHNLRDDAVRTYQPINSQELFAIERIAIAQQALLRCSELEVGLHTAALNETVVHENTPANLLTPELAGDIPTTAHQNRALCLAVGFMRLNAKSDSWKLFLRYQAQTERNYRRAVEEFERLRALRGVLPNEPTPIPEVEEIKLNTPPTLDPEGLPNIPLYDPTIPITSPLPPVPVKHLPKQPTE